MDFAKLGKLEPAGARPSPELEGVVSAIVKVREPGYRPLGVHVRSNISDNLFTGDLPAELLPTLEADPKVESISISRPVPLQKVLERG